MLPVRMVNGLCLSLASITTIGMVVTAYAANAGLRWGPWGNVQWFEPVAMGAVLTTLPSALLLIVTLASHKRIAPSEVKTLLTVAVCGLSMLPALSLALQFFE